MSKDKLPAPRLQLRWAASDLRSGYQWECHYELVLPLGEYDIRREQYDDEGNEVGKIDELIVPMKQPSLRGGSGTPCTAGDGSRYCDSPYRDGAHALWDAKILGNPPVFVIAPDGMAFPHKERI
ncbi:hypothetical protein [Paraburkholderia caledonica]|uniref:hypothetical protein n=1 Tax=Paraburkholderia caledonica TaxID=134536 RepID=UPI0038B8C5A0